MGALNPAFTESFEVPTDNYGDFIGNKVRPQVAKNCSQPRGVDQPVLPLEEKIPKLWFHVVLRTETSCLTLAIRMDNLNLVGFRNSVGEWWEFGKEGDTHLISDTAKWLGFGGSYKDLVPKWPWLITALGRRHMSYAVDSLAIYPTQMMQDDEDDDPHKTHKIMLMRLVIPLCEGLRFLTVSGTVDSKFDDDVAPTITGQEGEQVKYWDKISEAVLTNDFSHVGNETGIMDRESAKKIVALLKYQNSTDDNAGTSGVTVLA